MRMITYETFGAAHDVLKLADGPDHAPAPGEVQVDLAFSGVNPSDVKARAGSRPGVTKPPFPVIVPHSDGSGVISAVGEGIDPSRIGEHVWIWNGQWQRPFGTAATKITLPQDQAVALPGGVSLETGASLGIPGLTACHTVFGGGDITGQTVLVQGGAGTVGILAVQLAKWGGARVIATARGAGVERCRAAGADAVVDYTSETVAGQILEANNGAPIDRIIEVEFGQNIHTSAEVIANNGTMAVYGSARDMTPRIPYGPLMFKAVTIDISLIYILPMAQRQMAINRLHQALSAKALSCPVQQVFSLSDTADAHVCVEKGARTGAILVDVNA